MVSASEFCLDVIMDQVFYLFLRVSCSSPHAQQLAAFESLEHLHDMTLALFKVKESR